MITYDEEIIQKIREGQVGENIEKCQNAIPIIICADLLPSHNMENYYKLCTAGNVPKSFQENTKSFCNFKNSFSELFCQRTLVSNFKLSNFSNSTIKL